MPMDDITNRVMEFLIRSFIPDSLLQKTLTVLPLSTADSRLKTTILHRVLQTQLTNSSLSETSLDILQILEELYRNDGVSILDAMRSAYCAVAVDCTVKYLIFSPEEPSGEYFSAVRRIWRGRVGQLKGDGRELVSDELLKWGEEIEAALWDVRVSERLVSLNTRRDAVIEVKRYLKEAWEIMGTPFNANDLRLEGVCGIASGGGMLRRVDRSLDGSGKEKMRSVGDDNSDNVGGDVAEMGENHGNEELEERVGTSVDANQEVGGCNSAEGDKGFGANHGNEQLEERVGASDANQEFGGCNSAEGDKEIQNGNVQLKHKHSVVRPFHSGVKISGAEEEKTKKLSGKYETSSAEAKKIRESLKSSSMELQALVKDPLPDALHTSEVVRSKLATKDINIGPSSENQSGYVDMRDSNACMGIVLYQPNDSSLAKNSSVPCSNDHLPRPSIMERTDAARTYAWSDSIDNLSPRRQPMKRKRKWTTLEEDTLRAGVKKFGEGNWSTIRDFYSNILGNRSGVHLKDKWRNMMW